MLTIANMRQALNRKTFMKPILITIQVKTEQIVDGEPILLPHERDQKPDLEPILPRKIMKQAYKDLQNCLVDTDLHGQRGVEVVLENSKKYKSKK
jgi:hypothetical protein